MGNESSTTARQVILEGSAAIYEALDVRASANQSLQNSTVMRLRGLFTVWGDNPADGENPFGAIGAMIVSGEAFDLGVTAVPLPYDQNGDDSWLFHAFWHVGMELPAAGNPVGQLSTQITIDNKAMRKLENNDVVIYVIQNKSAAHAALFYWSVRTGVKLS